jgi:hypothetical protein
VITKSELIRERMGNALREIEERSQIQYICRKEGCGYQVREDFVRQRCRGNGVGGFECTLCGGGLVRMERTREYGEAIERDEMLQQRLKVVNESLRQLSHFYVVKERSEGIEGFFTRKEYRSKTNQLDVKTKEGVSLRMVVAFECEQLPPRRRLARRVKKEGENGEDSKEKESSEMDVEHPKDDAMLRMDEDGELSSDSIDDNDFWNPFEKKDKEGIATDEKEIKEEEEEQRDDDGGDQLLQKVEEWKK